MCCLILPASIRLPPEEGQGLADADLSRPPFESGPLAERHVHAHPLRPGVAPPLQIHLDKEWTVRECGNRPAPCRWDVGRLAELPVIDRRCVGGGWNCGCRIARMKQQPLSQAWEFPSPCRPHPPPHPGMSTGCRVPMAASSWSPAATPASATSSRSSCRQPEQPSYSAAGILRRPRTLLLQYVHVLLVRGCAPFGWTSPTSRRCHQWWSHWRWSALTRCFTTRALRLTTRHAEKRGTVMS